MCGLSQAQAWSLWHASVSPVSKEQKVARSSCSGGPHWQADIEESASTARVRFMVALIRAQGPQNSGPRSVRDAVVSVPATLTTMEAARLRVALESTPGLIPRAPAPADRIAALERRLSISLPPAYRRFVHEVADGLAFEGASWLFSLEEIERDLATHGSPSRPFPYGIEQAAAIRTALAAASTAGNVFTPEVLALQSIGELDGCLTLASNGGNDFSVLVVTGEQAGFVWRTGELDFPESPRLYDPRRSDDSPLDFEAWLVRWGECFLGLVV